MKKSLDVICIGRSSVDLYGEQVGGPLEDMASFAKYVGGCPTNIAIGTARLGLKSGLITAVGNEHMGRFILNTVKAEGVDSRGIKIDPERLTSLVILGIRDHQTFPLIFYRENCADAALMESDLDEGYIARAHAILVTGTHFSTPSLAAMSQKAVRLAKRSGAKVILDIDYRPVLWGLAGHGSGEERFIESVDVSSDLQSILSSCDLIVGTEEEIHIAGGSKDSLEACRHIRKLAPDALIVVKRGPMGCTIFDQAIPSRIEDGFQGTGLPVEVFNVLGAGDAFMSGFLRGYLREMPLEACCRLANAAGAFVVSRHGCAPAMPSFAELDHVLNQGGTIPSATQLHWSTTRKRRWPQLLAFAFDHRSHFASMAKKAGISPDHIPYAKALCLQACRLAADQRPDVGLLVDDRFGQAVLDETADGNLWIGRPIEVPGAVPLRFEGGLDLAATLRRWPVAHTVKCLVTYHPDDPEDLLSRQETELRRLFQATRNTGHELLLEVVPDQSIRARDETPYARALDRLYTCGIYPDWWKLPDPGSKNAWDQIAKVIDNRDSWCRGVLLLGLDTPLDHLEASIALAARQDVAKGFAIGRTIFCAPIKSWMAGEINDHEAVRRMSNTYGCLIDVWDIERAKAGLLPVGPGELSQHREGG